MLTTSGRILRFALVARLQVSPTTTGSRSVATTWAPPRATSSLKCPVLQPRSRTFWGAILQAQVATHLFFLKFFIRITQMLCVRRPSGLGLRRPDGMEQAAQITKLALQDKARFLGILLRSGAVELLVVPCLHPPAQPGWQ